MRPANPAKRRPEWAFVDSLQRDKGRRARPAPRSGTPESLYYYGEDGKPMKMCFTDGPERRGRSSFPRFAGKWRCASDLDAGAGRVRIRQEMRNVPTVRGRRVARRQHRGGVELDDPRHAFVSRQRA